MKMMLPGMYLMTRPLTMSQRRQDRARNRGARRQNDRRADLDHLVGGEGENFACTFAGNFENSSLEVARELLSRPCVIGSMSDAGAHVKYVCDGAMPTFQLTFWTRDRVRGPRLPLEFMVKKATLDCAGLYDLSDRGVLAPGKRADVNVIDYDRLNISMPHMTYDLPSGGGRLMQTGSGYLATLVAGKRHAGERPGYRRASRKIAPAFARN